MRALITGVNGFVGPYLKEHLLENNFEVYGTDISSGRDVDYKIDLLDSKEVEDLVLKTKPDFIFHLAAQSSVKLSWSKPKLTMEVNVNGTKNLLEAALKSNIKPNMLVVSSSEVYGIPKKIPITEEHELKAFNPYAESRLKQEEICEDYLKKGLKVIISRSFSHTGPGQLPVFVIPDFAKQIAEIEKGLREPVIDVGNLDVIRDFSDVRDIVRAYLSVIKKGKFGEIYNICSGKGTKLNDALNTLLSFSKKEIIVKVDKNKFRKSDLPVLVGDNSKLKKETGWHPKIPFEQTLKDTLNYWRNQ